MFSYVLFMFNCHVYLLLVNKTPIHYFIYCPAYSDHRNIFNNRLHAELSIDISDKQKLLNTILHGLNNTVTNKILIDIINEFMTLTKIFC